MSTKIIQINNNFVGIFKKFDNFIYNFGNKIF